MAMADLKITGSPLDTVPSDILPSELSYDKQIGKGQYGTVFVGKCRGITVAIKKLNELTLDDELLEDFRKEVNILRSIRHPNLLLFMGACTQGGQLAIVTEYLPGDNLQNILKNEKITLPLVVRVKIAKEAALGINWLHSSKPAIVHRDIKPANLLIDKNNHVKVCDFGFAAVKERGKKIENPDGAPGSPIWMGPEVLRGDPVDEKSDVYSFGIVLWEILTRKAPFSHHTQLKTFMKAIVEKCERPLIPPETLPSFRELIEKCWAHNPTDRPSFAEILPALDNILTEIAVADPQGRTLWKKHFSGLAEVEWDKFVAAFYSFLGLGAPLATDKKYIWLQSLCVAQVSDITKEKSTEVVTLENFGKFCSWFGPLNKDVLDRLSVLCAFPWFYGKMSTAEVSSLLTGKPKATFLVRLSESSEGCFTISKVEKTAEVNHQRVLYSLKDGTYTIAIAGKQMPFKSLPEIVAFKDLKLKIAPAEKNKFQMMLEGNKEPVYLK